MAASRSKAFSIGGVLSHTVAVLLRNLRAFAVLSLIGQGITYTVGQFIGADLFSLDLAGIWLGIMAWIFGYTFLSAAVSYATYRDMIGKNVGTREAITQGFTRSLSIFGTAVLVATIPAAVIERPSPVAALRRSIDLTSEKRWHIAGLLAALVATAVVLILAVEFLQGLGGPAAHDPFSAEHVVIQLLVGAFFLFWAVAGTVGYVLLRMDREGSRRDQIAAVFD